MAALGSQSGISKSQVSRICQEIDRQVPAFLARPLESSGYAYVYLDATYLKGRLGKALQVCSSAVVVAMGVNDDGRRELRGLTGGRQRDRVLLGGVQPLRARQGLRSAQGAGPFCRQVGHL